jgi:hypothetical protein
VGVLVLRDPDGDPIAVLANYSLHYVGGPFSLSISADYFGAFDRALQRMAGSKFIAIMANGCCGDINNCDFTRPAPTYPHPFYQVERVADVVASRAFGAWQRIRDWEGSPHLAAATEIMRFCRREPTPEEVAAAEELRAGPEQPANLDWTYASEVLAVREEPRERDTPIQALAVGNVGIVGLPGEIFVEYGLQIKAQSPFNRTFVVELANDYVGYCPTDLALQEGGYETRLARSAKAAAGTEGAMVAASLRTLQAAKEERS